MKKFIKFAFVAAIVAFSGYNVYQSQSVMNNVSELLLTNVESIAACESIGWWDNDGNCVKNDAGVYFCKSDSWPALTDCLQ
ncbi:MAG: hypothetical protein IJ413_09530 [Bacteroides sp.]|nr:hypothetical protein [Bacteroides sp.]